MFISIDRVCVPSDVLLGFMHLKKKQPPLLASYRETPSSVSLFTDYGGGSETFAGCATSLGLRMRFAN